MCLLPYDPVHRAPPLALDPLLLYLYDQVAVHLPPVLPDLAMVEGHASGLEPVRLGAFAVLPFSERPFRDMPRLVSRVPPAGELVVFSVVGGLGHGHSPLAEPLVHRLSRLHP